MSRLGCKVGKEQTFLKEYDVNQMTRRTNPCQQLLLNCIAIDCAFGKIEKNENLTIPSIL